MNNQIPATMFKIFLHEQGAHASNESHKLFMQHITNFSEMSRLHELAILKLKKGE